MLDAYDLSGMESDNSVPAVPKYFKFLNQLGNETTLPAAGLKANELLLCPTCGAVRVFADGQCVDCHTALVLKKGEKSRFVLPNLSEQDVN